MFRLFVGLPLPDDVRSSLRLLCGGLPGAKWVDPEAMHLTLRFIGDVDGGVAHDIDLSLLQVRAPEFDLVVSGVDCFEHGGKVHTLWAAVQAQPSLLHLRDKVESAVVRAGCDPERRKFKAHITLARFKNGVSDRIGPYLQRYNPFSIGPFAIDRFTLFRSHLLSQGAHYEPLAEYPLETRKGAASIPPR